MTDKFITRGISKETGEFVFGYYFKIKRKHYILEKNTYITLGFPSYIAETHFKEITQEPDRWTGLYDKDNNKIWENDIFGGVLESDYIKYCDKCAKFQIFNCLNECMACDGSIHINDEKDSIKLEIIGNLHFNKELLDK